MINEIIESAIGTIDKATYLRATDSEANTVLGDIDLSDITLCIYNNIPDIKNIVKSSIIREWPVEIQILQLASFDDNDSDGDVIRALCVPIADRIYDAIVSNMETVQAGPNINYNIKMLDQVKLYDKILTGVQLSFVLKVMRNVC